MRFTARTIRRAGFVMVAIAIATAGLVVPAMAQTGVVTGSITVAEPVSLSPSAVAVVTIIDQTASPDAGVVVGQQRIDSPGSVPIAFAVLYETDRVDPTHSYALLATIIDGANTWRNPVPTPIVTGGPTSGIDIVLESQPTNLPATVTGTLQLPAGATLSASAVAGAVLVNRDSGAIVNRFVSASPGPAPIAFSIGYDPDLIKPDGTYVVKAAVVDGANAWEGRAGVVAIEAGAAVPNVAVPLTAAPSPVPIPTVPPTGAPSAPPSEEPAPTEEPTAAPTEEPTAAPTEEPTAAPTEEPTAAPTEPPEPTEEPTAAPTAAPTAPPTAAPTPAPTATPTPSPTPTPVPSVSPSPSASPTPFNGVVTGTLAYDEQAPLSPDSVAIIVVVQGTATATTSSVVGSQRIDDPGQKPIRFSVTLDPASIDPDGVYTVQAAIADEPSAWVTTSGTPVITDGAPTSDLDLILDYRPNVLKGEVTGGITGVGIVPSAEAYSVAVLVDRSTGETLGIDSQDEPGELPIPFSIPFSPTEIDREEDYIVQASIVDGDSQWANTLGVPVITKDNPFTDIAVVVTQVAVASPSPSPTASPAPAPVEDDGLLGGVNPWLLAIIAALIAVIVWLFIKNRQTPPESEGSAEPEVPEPGPGDLDTAAEAPAAAEPAAAEPGTAAEPEGESPAPASPDDAGNEPGPDRST